MRTILLALSLLALPAVGQAYSFQIANNSSSKLTKLEVSEDGKEWSYFDIGSGVPANSTADATWDSSTDDSNCEWQVRASFADGTSSAPTTFDFCEEDLVVEFSD